MLDLWPDKFPPYGLLHAVVGVVSALGWVAAVAWTVRLLLPAHFEIGFSLPLQLCDLAWMAAGWSLWSGGDPQRLRHQLPVLWGLALSILAYLTPAVTSGPGGIHFWTFWISHGQILGVALVNLLAFRTRPDLRGLHGTLVLTTAATGFATVFNLAFGTSYFFTGRSIPSNPSPLDLLGDWPLRIVWVVLLGAAAITAVALPFLFGRRRDAGPRSGPADPKAL